ncbi:MAG: hypothetical protein J2P48_04925 [Alphaproteobacteria bacterium]|nr:hypothetical protein [Alphaproteobacteria bacterium]
MARADFAGYRTRGTAPQSAATAAAGKIIADWPAGPGLLEEIKPVAEHRSQQDLE